MCYGNKMRVKFRQSWVNIEKNNRFVDRVLILSVPAALVLVFLAVLDIISPLLAVFSYAAIVMFNLIFLLPVTVELQQLRRYISSLASGGEVRDDAVELSESETKEIVRAVNAMHRFWTQKADSLEAQSISDAAVLDTLPDPIMMIDRAGNIIGANLSSRALFGENITDKNIDHLIESNNFVEAVSRVLKKESESENLIFYTQKPFSQKLYAHIKSLPWQSKGRAVAVISLYDMTKSMRIEKMQSDFVANASHELRTPVAIAEGALSNLQLLLDRNGDPHVFASTLDSAHKQILYLGQMVNDLSTLSRAQRGLYMNDEDIDINEFMTSLYNKYSDEAKARGLRMVVDIDVKGKVTVPSMVIEEIMQNLITNAIKYTDKGGVTIGVSPVTNDGKHAKFYVKDTGIGISKSDQEHIFQRFWRSEDYRTRQTNGTGLGLHVVEQLATKIGAKVNVDSELNVGSTFSIILPISKE